MNCRARPKGLPVADRGREPIGSIRPPQQGQIGRVIGELPARFAVAGGRSNAGDGKQCAAQREFFGTTAVGEKAVMADAVKPVRQGVQQEAPDEFVGRQRHDLVLVVVPIIAPAEADLAAGERRPAGCWRWRRGACSGRDRPAPPRGRQRALGIDDPLDAAAVRRRRRAKAAASASPASAPKKPAAGVERRLAAFPGTAGGTGARARAPAGRSRAGRKPSACRPATSRRRGRGNERADGAAGSGPRCGARR